LEVDTNISEEHAINICRKWMEMSKVREDLAQLYSQAARRSLRSKGGGEETEPSLEW
jgi:hypothetical protein